jgi:hypothetical protein
MTQGYSWLDGCPAIDPAQVFGGSMGGMMVMANCYFYLGSRTKIGYVEIEG